MTTHNIFNTEFNQKSKKEVRIHIGDFYTSNKAVIISTLLGSCVSACLYDKKKRVAGMNHILLPGKADFKNFNRQTRYSINAMEILINDMMKKGADRNNLVAKVFGGANVIPSIKINSIGPKISRFVIHFLKLEGIPVMVKDVGGVHPRKIYFHTDSKDVYVKKLKPVKLLQVRHLESKKLKTIEQEIKKPGEITFF